MTLMHRYLKVVIILLFLPSLSIAAQFKVFRVTYGDTIKVVNNGKALTIRLVGVDAPETSKRKNEPGQPFSQKSTNYLAGLFLNKMVDIKPYGQDRYGRTPGVVFVDGMNANLKMVQKGLAEVYRGRAVKGFDNEPYNKAEAEAKESKLMMWSLGEKYFSPREWRRMQK